MKWIRRIYNIFDRARWDFMILAPMLCILFIIIGINMWAWLIGFNLLGFVLCLFHKEIGEEKQDE